MDRSPRLVTADRIAAIIGGKVWTAESAAGSRVRVYKGSHYVSVMSATKLDYPDRKAKNAICDLLIAAGMIAVTSTTTVIG